MVTSPMTSRALERSRSWPRYIWYLISWNVLEIECPFQWSGYRKSYMANWMVTWLMTSRDPERLRSRPEYIGGLISRKQFKVRVNGAPVRNHIVRVKLSRHQWRHMTLRDQRRDLDTFGSYYLEILVSQTLYFWILGVLSDFFGLIYAHMPTNWSPR